MADRMVTWGKEVMMTVLVIAMIIIFMFCFSFVKSSPSCICNLLFARLKKQECQIYFDFPTQNFLEFIF